MRWLGILATGAGTLIGLSGAFGSRFENERRTFPEDIFGKAEPDAAGIQGFMPHAG
jgi:hypothetical protein